MIRKGLVHFLEDVIRCYPIYPKMIEEAQEEYHKEVYRREYKALCSLIDETDQTTLAIIKLHYWQDNPLLITKVAEHLNISRRPCIQAKNEFIHRLSNKLGYVLRP